MEQCHWPTAVEAQKYGGMHALWPSRMPRSDNVVGLLTCGPVSSCSACRLARLAAARGKLNKFPPGLQGGAEETEITQAFASKRYIHNLITRCVQLTRQSPLVEAQPSSLPVGPVGLALSQSQLMDLAREGSRSPSHLSPLLMSYHLLPWRDDKSEGSRI